LRLARASTYVSVCVDPGFARWDSRHAAPIPGKWSFNSRRRHSGSRTVRVSGSCISLVRDVPGASSREQRQCPRSGPLGHGWAVVSAGCCSAQITVDHRSHVLDSWKATCYHARLGSQSITNLTAGGPRRAQDSALATGLRAVSNQASHHHLDLVVCSAILSRCHTIRATRSSTALVNALADSSTNKWHSAATLGQTYLVCGSPPASRRRITH